MMACHINARIVTKSTRVLWGSWITGKVFMRARLMLALMNAAKCINRDQTYLYIEKNANKYIYSQGDSSAGHKPHAI